MINRIIQLKNKSIKVHFWVSLPYNQNQNILKQIVPQMCKFVAPCSLKGYIRSIPEHPVNTSISNRKKEERSKQQSQETFKVDRIKLV